MTAGIMFPPGTYACPTCGMKHYGKSLVPYYCQGWTPDHSHPPAAVIPAHAADARDIHASDIRTAVRKATE